MKKMFAAMGAVLLLLVYTCVPSMSLGENEITEESFEKEFATILELKRGLDRNEIERFAAKHNERIVEFDGFIYDIRNTWSNKYNIELFPGDYKNRDTSKTSFILKDVTPEELGFADGKLPSNIDYGSDVHVVSKIIGYDSYESSISLAPISLKKRIPLLEGLDTSIYVELAKGSKGDTVKILQQRLIDLKFLKGEADGKYGKNTTAAIEKFQKSCGLEVTGIADPDTQGILFSENAPEAQLSISCSSVSVGSKAMSTWYVDGKNFTLKGNQTKTIKTDWGNYKFHADGTYEKLD